MDAPLAPSPLHLYWAKVANVNATTKEEEALIKQQFTTIGIELGKRSFQFHGARVDGSVRSGRK